jgi:hypothetical protein
MSDPCQTRGARRRGSSAKLRRVRGLRQLRVSRSRLLMNKSHRVSNHRVKVPHVHVFARSIKPKNKWER